MSQNALSGENAYGAGEQCTKLFSQFMQRLPCGYALGSEPCVEHVKVLLAAVVRSALGVSRLSVRVNDEYIVLLRSPSSKQRYKLGVQIYFAN
jgi:hypothetical protein